MGRSKRSKVSKSLINKRNLFINFYAYRAIISWNAVDGKIDRRSHMGQYKIVNGVPLNPLGRCGIKGRGLLGIQKPLALFESNK